LNINATGNRPPSVLRAEGLVRDAKQRGFSAESHLLLIREMMYLNLPISSEFLTLDTAARLRTIASLVERMAGDGEVPVLSSTTLTKRPLDFQDLYRAFLRNIYEVAALFDIEVTQHSQSNRIDDAIKFYQYYKYYASGHADQQNRIELATERIDSLTKDNGKSDGNKHRLMPNTEPSAITELTGPFGLFFVRSLARGKAQNETDHLHSGRYDRSRMLGDLVISSMTEAERRTAHNALVGEWPGGINAYAGITDAGERSVVVRSDLLGLLYQLLDIFLFDKGPEAESMVKRHIRNAILYWFNPDIGGPPNELIASLKKANNFGTSIMKHMTVLCMELFIICHEFGHHLCGHLGSCALADPVGSLYGDTSTESHAREFQADAKGFELYDRIVFAPPGRRIDPFFDDWVAQVVQAKCGFDMFFSAVDIATRSMRSAGLIGDRSTHPPATSRRQAVRRAYYAKHPEDEFLWAWALAFQRHCDKHSSAA
jgi:hypothetical protein